MRAPRFPLGLPVHYRPVHEPAWRYGRTENISHSGALVLVELEMPVDTAVEVRLVLPGATAGEHAEVVCRGRVVRAIAPTPDHPRPGVAFAIQQYDFLR